MLENGALGRQETCPFSTEVDNGGED